MEIKKDVTKEAAKQEKKEVKLEILDVCGKLDERDYDKKDGTHVHESLELRYLKWNDGDPKYDIRWWNGPYCSKGIGMTPEALQRLKDILDS